jgi:hypothetical protein
MPLHITLARLTAHNACADQVARFRKHFLDGQALVTSAACLALVSVFDWLSTTPQSLPHWLSTAPRSL